jgi:hypothetical protein
VIQRFRWIDNKSFKIVNSEGVEEWVDYTDNFKAISYNMVPEFSEELDLLHEGRSYGYFFGQAELKPHNVLHQLKRKYRNYKSAYYMD